MRNEIFINAREIFMNKKRGILLYMWTVLVAALAGGIAFMICGFASGLLFSVIGQEELGVMICAAVYLIFMFVCGFIIYYSFIDWYYCKDHRYSFTGIIRNGIAKYRRNRREVRLELVKIFFKLVVTFAVYSIIALFANRAIEKASLNALFTGSLFNAETAVAMLLYIFQICSMLFVYYILNKCQYSFVCRMSMREYDYSMNGYIRKITLKMFAVLVAEIIAAIGAVLISLLPLLLGSGDMTAGKVLFVVAAIAALIYMLYLQFVFGISLVESTRVIDEDDFEESLEEEERIENEE